MLFFTYLRNCSTDEKDNQLRILTGYRAIIPPRCASLKYLKRNTNAFAQICQVEIMNLDIEIISSDYESICI